MMNNSNPIGFFDSGIGGLSVYSCFKNKMPIENTIYLADLKNLPYGNKTKEELINIARKNLDFFKTQKAKAVVIACNTLSANTYEILKNDYDFKIYPIVQISSEIISKMNYSRIGIFATKATVTSRAYTNNLKFFKSGIITNEIPCPDWVDFIERGKLNTIEARKDFMSKMETMLHFQPEKIILGCTHYPILINYFIRTNEAKRIYLNPAEIFAEYIISDLKRNDMINNKKEVTDEFYVTDNPDRFLKNSKLFYKINKHPKLIAL